MDRNLPAGALSQRTGSMAGSRDDTDNVLERKPRCIRHLTHDLDCSWSKVHAQPSGKRVHGSHCSPQALPIFFPSACSLHLVPLERIIMLCIGTSSKLRCMWRSTGFKSRQRTLRQPSFEQISTSLDVTAEDHAFVLLYQSLWHRTSTPCWAPVITLADWQSKTTQLSRISPNGTGCETRGSLGLESGSSWPKVRTAVFLHRPVLAFR